MSDFQSAVESLPDVASRLASSASASPLLCSQSECTGRPSRDALLRTAIGNKVRSYRRKIGVTASDLAAAASISVGMLSKIENGSISPSLGTLQAVSSALGLPLAVIFQDCEEPTEAIFVKSGGGVDVQRPATRMGHRYSLLGYTIPNDNDVVVEPYLITLEEHLDKYPQFQHDGLEFIFVLEGEMVYLHGDKSYQMTTGDSLFFEAKSPHGPSELIKLPIRILSIVSYRPGVQSS